MELAKAVKRTAEAIFEHGGVIRSMENVGSRQLPYKMFKHGSRHEHGKLVIWINVSLQCNLYSWTRVQV